jgi:MATE family multidrug resistance protein
MAMAMTVGYMGTLSLIYFLFRRPLIGWFNDDPEIIRIGAQVMVCAAVFQLFDAAGITYNSALRGAGDTFWPSMIYIGCTWGILMGGGYLIARFLPEMGSLGPWLAASGLIIVAAFLLWWRWHSRAWMRINLFRREDGRTGASPAADERASACVTACEAP